MEILPKIINCESVFYDNCEVYYSLRTIIEPKEYPQVHDFYEIILVTRNTMNILLNNDTLELHRGDLLLICPGDIHTKIETGASTHLNLAFPSYTLEALFHYLHNLPNPLSSFSSDSHVPVVHLSMIDTDIIQKRLDYLNQLPYTLIDEKNTHLRVILLDMMYAYIIPTIKQQNMSKEEISLPPWLSQALNGLCSSTSHLSQGMEYLTQQTGRSSEHICRCFRKYLNVTPSSYINEKRLIYSANLLMQTDMEIVDIIYESGFQSVNYYYHLFKKKFGVSPLKYKKVHQKPNL